jgi:biopolymer transport protein TolQ
MVKRLDHPMAMMFAAAMEEWREAPASTEPAVHQSLLRRVARVMSLTMDREVGALEKHMSSLATIGSTAPFVGLFGTVWGIMNSFQSIAVTKNTTLAVVAPGIAEALFATALGLVAAIPAVIAYNKLSGEVDRYADRLDSFSEEFSVVLSRELDSSRVA